MSTEHERRIEALEAQRGRLETYAMASRIAAVTRISLDELLAEAGRIQELADWSGMDSVIAELASEANCTIEELEASANRIMEQCDAA